MLLWERDHPGIWDQITENGYRYPVTVTWAEATNTRFSQTHYYF
jgi:hypothetical protein